MERRYRSSVGAILPEDARVALASLDRLRGRVRIFVVEIFEALPEMRDLTPEDRVACRTILDDLEPQIGRAIEVAHVAVADWTRMRIGERALMTALEDPERLLAAALQALWDVARTIG
jgi:hypothetical protein